MEVTLKAQEVEEMATMLSKKMNSFSDMPIDTNGQSAPHMAMLFDFT